jgi:hypothetical protein
MAFMAELMRGYILYIVMPIWLIAGLGDWLCHRKAGIEMTAGAKESSLHLLMLFQIGIPVLACLFLEINAGIILLIIAMFLLHELTAWWDVNYADSKRKITPTEQHMHSFLEVIPFLVMSLLFILHWPQVLSLFGSGPELPDYSLRWKEQPLPLTYIIGLLIAVVIFQIAPYFEEFYRCVSWKKKEKNRLKIMEKIQSKRFR